MVVEDMEIDDYTRDRSRSPPRRDRSRSPERRERSPPRRSYDRGGDRRPYRSSYGNDRYRDSRDRYPRGGGGGDSFRDRADRNHNNSVFVGNLPFTCQWYDLKDHFKSIGDIVRADIVMSQGRSKGMGTVEFRTKEDVDRAIAQMNHSTFMNREIFVRQDYPPPGGDSRPPSRYDDRRGAPPSRYDDRRGAPPSRYEERRPFERRAPPPEGTEIFVGNLPFRTNWQDLKDLFRNVGEVVRADVRQDERGRSKGFGTVIFATKEDAQKAKETYDQYELDGRRIDIREGRTSGPRPQHEEPVNKNSEFTDGVTGGNEIASETIFADNLPYATANEDLFDLFETVGKVEQAEIKYAPDGRSSGSAVVRFSHVDEAASAIEKLNNYEYGNRPLKLSFAIYPNASAPDATSSGADDVAVTEAAPAPPAEEQEQEQPMEVEAEQ